PPTVQNFILPTFNSDLGPIFITWDLLFQNASVGPANESNQTLSGIAAFSPVGGTVLAMSGGVIFTPAAGYDGPARFVFLARDNGITNGQPDPQAAAGAVQFSVIRTTTPPAAIS